MSAFLKAHGWNDARQSPLAGDASARRYWRLLRDTAPRTADPHDVSPPEAQPGGPAPRADDARPGSAILMSDPGGDVARFARLARHLTGLGLSAPRIYAMDAARGRMLIEDLGDGLIARRAIDGPTERALYQTATDALVELHRHAPPADLPTADPGTLVRMIEPAFSHYAPGAAPWLPDAIHVLLPVMQAHAVPADVMMLRDYHAENILDLPDRPGAARAGLLDFQDAMIGHRAYDLASLLRDARRDLRPGTAQATLEYYLSRTGLDAAPFQASFSALSVQRNLRILGVFARLAGQGKPQYLRLLPRVWRHIQTDLAHPACEPLRAIAARLPHPTQPHLNSLRRPCPNP